MTATAPPPTSVNSPAPSSGVTSRRPSISVCRAPFASASRSAGTSAGSSAVSAGPSTLPITP